MSETGKWVAEPVLPPGTRVRLEAKPSQRGRVLDVEPCGIPSIGQFDVWVLWDGDLSAKPELVIGLEPQPTEEAQQVVEQKPNDGAGALTAVDDGDWDEFNERYRKARAWIDEAMRDACDAITWDADVIARAMVAYSDEIERDRKEAQEGWDRANEKRMRTLGENANLIGQNARLSREKRAIEDRLAKARALIAKLVERVRARSSALAAKRDQAKSRYAGQYYIGRVDALESLARAVGIDPGKSDA